MVLLVVRQQQPVLEQQWEEVLVHLLLPLSSVIFHLMTKFYVQADLLPLLSQASLKQNARAYLGGFEGDYLYRRCRQKVR
jgi:hypothetical protein